MFNVANKMCDWQLVELTVSYAVLEISRNELSPGLYQNFRPFLYILNSVQNGTRVKCA